MKVIIEINNHVNSEHQYEGNDQVLGEGQGEETDKNTDQIQS